MAMGYFVLFPLFFFVVTCYWGPGGKRVPLGPELRRSPKPAGADQSGEGRDLSGPVANQITQRLEDDCLPDRHTPPHSPPNATLTADES